MTDRRSGTLQAASIPLRAGTRLVPIDFEAQTLREALAGAEEPWNMFYEPDELAVRLRGQGFLCGRDLRGGVVELALLRALA